MVPAAYARIVAGIAERVGAMLVRVIEEKTLLGVFATEKELPAIQQDRPGRMMGLQQKPVVPFSLGQLEEFV